MHHPTGRNLGIPLCIVALVGMVSCPLANAQERDLASATCAFRITLGLRDAEPQKFDGSVSVAPGEVVGVEGWRFEKGDKVTLVGFGTFSTSHRSAREGRNPQTGKPIKIPAKKVATFSPGTALKDAIN